MLDEIRAIAETGLHYATDPYDRERCTRLLDLATRGYAAALDLPEPEVRARLARDLGYQSAKVGSDAAIFDEDGRILLVHRSDTDNWGLISGWVDPGESPEETAVREVREEVGLEVTGIELVDVLGRPASARFGPHAVVSVIYLCTVAPDPVTISHEAFAAEYRDPADVEAWHANHEQLARIAAAAWAARRD
ncbi:MAG: NUDIX hydrolase N-terminal domain-containing protein [Acidimicrobiia bacterium]